MSASLITNLQQYRSHKTVHAAEIVEVLHTGCNLKHANGTIGYRHYAKDMTARYTPVVGDYWVVYPDGYQAISPRQTFVDGYTEVGASSQGIGWAVEAMRSGAKVARAGWNGKGMFLFLVPGSKFLVNRAPLLGIYPEGTEISYHAHVDMKTAGGDVVPWLASQTDLLATDWEVAE